LGYLSQNMLAFENVQALQTRYQKKPVFYQVDIIAQTWRQIKDFSGSILVASTGLGKTVVALHVALHLRIEKLIKQFAPIANAAEEESEET